MGVRSVTKELVAITGGAKFILVELDKGVVTPIYDGDGQLLKFTDGAAAAKEALRYTEKVGRKVQPRRVNDDDWRKREETKLDNGEHLPLPWSRERWWLDLKHVWGDHYPHVSLQNGAMLAFTETEEKGAADIQTRIKPGRYLERQFGDKKLLNAYVIRDLCTVFSAKYEDNVLMFAETEDEVEEVYTTGPSSCMSHPVSNFQSGGIHPARVYASPDLKVAYMKREGRVVARSVVYPDKKLYTSLYGDSGRLKPMLEKAGFRSGAPYGARILRFPVNMDPKTGLHQFVVPHIDHVLWVTDEGDFLRVGAVSRPDGSGIDAGGAKGVSEMVGYKCTRCESPASLSQKQIIQVFISEKQTRNWCKTCSNTHAFKCSLSGYWVAKDQGHVMTTKSGSKMLWRRYWVGNGFVCPGDGLNYWNSDGVMMADGVRWGPAHYKANGGARCHSCGKGNAGANKCDETCAAKAKAARASDTSYAAVPINTSIFTVR